MRISFVIPAYNEEKLIGKCLESIQKVLAAGTYDAEIIVVNNASTDQTKEIAQQFKDVIVVDEMHKGLTFARQAGFEASTGELIANVDSDTMFTPEWIPTVLAAFEKDKNLVALSGPFIYYDLSIVQRAFVKLFYIFGYLLHLLNHLFHTGAMLQGGNFVLRRSALEQVGGFDTSITFYGEDTDIAARISKVGTVVWTFKLPILASGRRLAEEGVIKMGLRYAINHLTILYFKKPYTNEYVDVRP